MVKKILGVKINDISSKEALGWVEHWINRKAFQPRLIATVGPEFIVTAQTDRNFRHILNEADLCLPEGVGLQRFGGIQYRTPGTDFMLSLCMLADREEWKIGLIGGKKGIAEQTKKVLREKFPNLKIIFSLDGAEADQTMSHVNSNQQLNRNLSCDILFAAFGHPKQEKFLEKIIRNSKDESLTNKTPIKFKVGMGVGGAFDQISGNISRPPQWITNLGFEWLYRVFAEKSGKRINRFIRVFKASVVFPLLMLFHFN